MSFIDMADTGQIIDLEPREIGEATAVLTPPPPRRLDPTFRRRPESNWKPPAREPFSAVDKPAETGQLPAYVQAALYVTRPTPVAWPTPPPVPTVRDRRRYIGRHRANRARRGWIGGDR